ncbi:Flagellar hook-length control protein FliK [compost metagenome]
MIPLDSNLRVPTSGTVVALPTGGAEKIEGDLLRALLLAGKVEARVLQVLNQTALLDFLNLGSAKVRTEVPLRAGDVFTAVVEPRPEGSADPLKLRIAEIRHEPASPLKAERLAAQLEGMSLPTDAKHQAMARALLRHAGTVSREAMTQLNEALIRLSAKAGGSEAPPEGAVRMASATPQAARLPVPVRVLEAAAFLVSKNLPVTEEAVEWVAGRLNATTTAGERMGAIARRLPEPVTPAAQALVELALPDGDPAETAEHLAKLAKAFTPPEARLARMIAAEPPSVRPAAESPVDPLQARSTEAVKEPTASVPRQDSAPSADAGRPAASLPPRGMAEPLVKIQEALTAVLERAVRSGEGGEPIREALSEVRFGQLVNASSSDPLQAAGERSVAMPLWWSGGSGEIRVKYQPRDGKKRSGGDAEDTRVVVTLDTTHLQRVKIDLLLGRKQLNCQVAVEDQAVAEVLRQRLPELQEALETTGLRVNALGVKHVSPQAPVTAIDALRQVDVWL